MDFIHFSIYQPIFFSVLIALFFQLMAEERGLIVDVEGFNEAMDEARVKSRSARNKVIGWFVFFINPLLIIF